MGSAGTLLRDGGPGVDLDPDDHRPVIHDEVAGIDGDAAAGAGGALIRCTTRRIVGAILLTLVGAIRSCWCDLPVGAIVDSRQCDSVRFGGGASPLHVVGASLCAFFVCRCDRDAVTSVRWRSLTASVRASDTWSVRSTDCRCFWSCAGLMRTAAAVIGTVGVLGYLPISEHG